MRITFFGWGSESQFSLTAVWTQKFVQRRGDVITGCAVAQQCYNGDVSFLLKKMENLTPCKFESLQQINTKFVSIDYVHERNVCSKFDKNPFTGDFWAKRWNITFCVTFLFIFFSDQRREETPGRIVTRNGSKDAECAKMWLFGLSNEKNEIWSLFTSKNLKIWPWIGNFQSKWWNMKLEVYQKVLNQSRWKFNTMLVT